jgi:hypothetical protein
MTSSISEVDFEVTATNVIVTPHHLTVDLEDGRIISLPLTWFPRLMHATPAERANVENQEDALYWPDLNEGLSIKSIILGRRSGESAKSLERWLERRARGEKEVIPTLPLPPDIADRLTKMGVPLE